jgi:hypothetical protein
MNVQTLTGQITGTQIEGDTKTQYCNYHLPLKRLGSRRATPFSVAAAACSGSAS